MNKTLQREAILHELRMRKDHPTAEELYGALHEAMPQLSLGTVYRNLEQLSAAGIIRKLDVSGKRMRFDGDISPHHHIRCRECGGVRDIPGAATMVLDRQMERMKEEYQCDSYTLEFKGVCPACSASGKQNKLQ
ncbi:MAG: transcriptional repressor [Lentisphaeria bacterium]|nr:transcriptional repressor [Lentisphaeria bacterium]